MGAEVLLSDGTAVANDVAYKALGRSPSPAQRLAALHTLATLAGAERSGRSGKLLAPAAEDALRVPVFEGGLGVVEGIAWGAMAHCGDGSNCMMCCTRAESYLEGGPTITCPLPAAVHPSARTSFLQGRALRGQAPPLPMCCASSWTSPSLSSGWLSTAAWQHWRLATGWQGRCAAIPPCWPSYVTPRARPASRAASGATPACSSWRPPSRMCWAVDWGRAGRTMLCWQLRRSACRRRSGVGRTGQLLVPRSSTLPPCPACEPTVVVIGCCHAIALPVVDCHAMMLQWDATWLSHANSQGNRRGWEGCARVRCLRVLARCKGSWGIAGVLLLGNTGWSTVQLR